MAQDDKLFKIFEKNARLFGNVYAIEKNGGVPKYHPAVIHLFGSYNPNLEATCPAELFKKFKKENEVSK